MARKSFTEELYQKSSLSELIIFSINSVTEKKESCTFERLTKECFDLFPKSFSLFGFLKWPDSRKLDRPLRSLRRKKLIGGNPKENFNLTKSGKKIAEEVAKRFRQERFKL